MASYFAPYSGDSPAPLMINGHRLLILSKDREAFEDRLQQFGADRVKRVQGGDSRVDEEVVLEELAKAVQGGVVIAPNDLELPELIRSLESQLPWLQ